MAIESQNFLIKFLQNAFFITKERYQDINLEDIYTPIDRCIIENATFRGYTVQQLQEIRARLDSLISHAIDNALRTSQKNKSYISTLVQFLSYKSSMLRPTIVSTNWDIVLDSLMFLDANNDINYGIEYYKVIDPFNIHNISMPNVIANAKWF